jgi:hypothetical protein
MGFFLAAKANPTVKTETRKKVKTTDVTTLLALMVNTSFSFMERTDEALVRPRLS